MKNTWKGNIKRKAERQQKWYVTQEIWDTMSTNDRVVLLQSIQKEAKLSIEKELSTRIRLLDDFADQLQAVRRMLMRYVCGIPNNSQTKKAKGGSKMKTEKKGTKKVAKKVAAKKVTIARDQYGFREGSHVSKLFVALKKGADIDALKKIAGASTYKTISEFKMSQKKNPRGRNAVVDVNDKGVWKITKHVAPIAAE